LANAMDKETAVARTWCGRHKRSAR